MGDEWKIDLKIPDIGMMVTLMTTALCSMIMGAAEIAYTMLWITASYVRHGKDFFIDLLNAKALTWTAEYILVAGSLLLFSAILFLLSSTFSLYELNGLAKNVEKKVHTKVVFGFFVGGLILLFLALISAIILRYL
ncbi:MAG: hypothetical protein PWQ51_1216 [Methanolobus sp.]|uniref:Uncharacterized protein n=1 Tax=Methanolobus tindarius DSM 2278 TaxID=1090322 RepID=W9DW63_METTI|nr:MULTISPECIES: hypothetical protein [Methanolobus]ETA67666.1 hypothetical protein MettiDRAFT_1094 [Methanolobus tindarius DSM 2278]MDK2832475.1 hypothetical protein [Methanolobus sp.]MDK2939052.1 hypothetical protein [Methanolobus sp.]